MLDLTGENLTTYLLRELRDVVNRNPRFRNMGGDVFIQTSNMLAWGDVQVLISGIQASGNRLSPDYFMCTKHGHAILAKVEGKDGVFIDWVQEHERQTDANFNLTYPIPGIYYLNVDAVNEATREVSLTMETYRWSSSSKGPALGSKIALKSGIDAGDVTPLTPDVELQQIGSELFLKTFTDVTPLRLQTSVELTPMVDFWYERPVTVTLTEATAGGTEALELPGNDLQGVRFYDNNGYELREGVDFVYASPTSIRLGPYSPPGHKVFLDYVEKADPAVALAVHPENRLDLGPITPDQTLAQGQVQLRSSYGDVYSESDLFIDPAGGLWLKPLLRRGETVTWDIRIDAGQSEIVAKKLASNFNIIPGLSIGMGDMVNVGDQCAILVSPDMTETYEVYGSKENISFDIYVKANDRLTASDISTLIRSHLLVHGRASMEANGLSVFEVSKAPQQEPKGNGGVSVATTIALSVSAAADWELYVPLTVRIGHFEIEVGQNTSHWLPKSPEILPRLVSFGQPMFVNSYR